MNDQFVIREAGDGFFVTHRLGAAIFAQGLPFQIALTAADQANAVLRICPQRSLEEIWNFITGET